MQKKNRRLRLQMRINRNVTMKEGGKLKLASGLACTLADIGITVEPFWQGHATAEVPMIPENVSPVKYTITNSLSIVYEWIMLKAKEQCTLQQVLQYRLMICLKLCRLKSCAIS